MTQTNSKTKDTDTTEAQKILIIWNKNSFFKYLSKYPPSRQYLTLNL